jgi:hypothetical protein
MIRATLIGVAMISPAAAQTPLLDALAQICGNTHHFYAGPGNQIEYHAPDGTAFLWHPEAEDVVVGTWRMGESAAGDPLLCYTYPIDSLRPGFNGEEFCNDAAVQIAATVPGGVSRGDRFNLSSGEQPFPIQAHPMWPPESYPDRFPELSTGPSCDGVPLS